MKNKKIKFIIMFGVLAGVIIPTSVNYFLKSKHSSNQAQFKKKKESLTTQNLVDEIFYGKNFKIQEDKSNALKSIQIENNNFLELVDLNKKSESALNNLIGKQKPIYRKSLKFKEKISSKEFSKHLLAIKKDINKQVIDYKAQNKQIGMKIFKNFNQKNFLIELYILRQTTEFRDWVDDFARDLGKIKWDTINFDNPQEFFPFLTGKNFITGYTTTFKYPLGAGSNFQILKKYLDFVKLKNLEKTKLSSSLKTKENLFETIVDKSIADAEKINVRGDDITSKELIKKFFKKWVFLPNNSAYSFKKYIHNPTELNRDLYNKEGQLIAHSSFNDWYFKNFPKRKELIFVIQESFIDFNDENKFKILLTFSRVIRQRWDLKTYPILAHWSENIKTSEIAKRVIVSEMPQKMYSQSNILDSTLKFTSKNSKEHPDDLSKLSSQQILDIMKSAFVSSTNVKISAYENFLKKNKLIQIALNMLGQKLPHISYQFKNLRKILNFLYIKKKEETQKIFTNDFFEKLLRELDQNKFVNVRYAFTNAFSDFVKNSEKKDYFWNSLNKLQKATPLNGGSWRIYQFLSAWNVISKNILLTLAQKGIISNIQEVLGEEENYTGWDKFSNRGISKLTSKDFEEMLKLPESISEKEISSSIVQKIKSFTSKISKKTFANILYKILTQGVAKFKDEDWKEIASILIKMGYFDQKSQATLSQFLKNLIVEGWSEDDFTKQLRGLFDDNQIFKSIFNEELFSHFFTNDKTRDTFYTTLKLALIALKVYGLNDVIKKENFDLVLRNLFNGGILNDYPKGEKQSMLGSSKNIKQFLEILTDVLLKSPEIKAKISKDFQTVLENIVENKANWDSFASALLKLLDKPFIVNGKLQFTEKDFQDLFKVISPNKGPSMGTFIYNFISKGSDKLLDDVRELKRLWENMLDRGK